jgi:hypothetical protein
MGRLSPSASRWNQSVMPLNPGRCGLGTIQMALVGFPRGIDGGPETQSARERQNPSSWTQNRSTQGLAQRGSPVQLNRRVIRLGVCPKDLGRGDCDCVYSLTISTTVCFYK